MGNAKGERGRTAVVQPSSSFSAERALVVPDTVMFTATSLP